MFQKETILGISRLLAELRDTAARIVKRSNKNAAQPTLPRSAGVFSFELTCVKIKSRLPIGHAESPQRDGPYKVWDLKCQYFNGSSR